MIILVFLSQYSGSLGQVWLPVSSRDVEGSKCFLPTTVYIPHCPKGTFCFYSSGTFLNRGDEEGGSLPFLKQRSLSIPACLQDSSHVVWEWGLRVAWTLQLHAQPLWVCYGLLTTVSVPEDWPACAPCLPVPVSPQISLSWSLFQKKLLTYSLFACLFFSLWWWNAIVLSGFLVNSETGTDPPFTSNVFAAGELGIWSASPPSIKIVYVRTAHCVSEPGKNSMSLCQIWTESTLNKINC